MLSQQFGDRAKRYPVVFFSKNLTPTEQKYNVEYRELITIKLPLKEWQHWLKGATYPFVILTDHNILEYLHMVKRLNAHHAHQSSSVLSTDGPTCDQRLSASFLPAPVAPSSPHMSLNTHFH